MVCFYGTDNKRHCDFGENSSKNSLTTVDACRELKIRRIDFGINSVFFVNLYLYLFSVLF